MVKRIVLFLLTNLLIIATISLVTSLLGIKPYLTKHGLDYQSLALFCAVWGTAGAFISLALSKFMAKQFMGVRVIDPQRATGLEQRLLSIVYGLAQKVGIHTMPEVGVYDSPEINAFATGPTKNKALVAVSSGLLNRMNTDEIEGVLGHEISHIANGDMVTMTLIQGIVNAFAMFLSRIIAYLIASATSGSRNNEGESISYLAFYTLTIVFDILFTLLGSLVTAAFSRWREYRADRGGAQLAGKYKMIAALERLKGTLEIEDNRAPSLATLKIAHKPSIFHWWASHPSLDARIERLQNEVY